MTGLPSNQIFLSVFEGCRSVKPTGTVSLARVLEVVRNGDKHLKQITTQIQNNFDFEFDIAMSQSGNELEARRKAQKAVSQLKMGLWAVTFSGTFSERRNEALVQHSGLLCADLDNLTESEIRLHQKSWRDYPQVRAFYRSPSGHGLKVIFNILPDPTRHNDSFRAIQKFIRDETGKEVDPACRDLARLSFLAYCPKSYMATEVMEL